MIMKMSPDELMGKYGAIVTTLMSRMKVPSNYWEDIKNDGYIGLLKAQETYTESKAAFSTWAWINIRKHISESIYRNIYSYGMSSSYYYNRARNGEEIHTISVETIGELDDHIDHTITDNARAIAMFCSKLNMKYSEDIVALIVDYYIVGMKYGELKKKYGNITRQIRKIDLTDIFAEIKKEF